MECWRVECLKKWSECNEMSEIALEKVFAISCKYMHEVKGECIDTICMSEE
jgi:hypothetical protein